MSKKNIYFKNLDTIRFIAAMMVFIGHAMSSSFRHLDIKDTVFEKGLAVISNGGMGVSIFFVLSGFLITYLIISEIEVNGRLNIKSFYMRRFLRIWPLYYTVVIFSFLVYPSLKIMLGINTPLGSNFIYHLFFLSNFDVIQIAQNCNGLDAMSQNITWSVSVEEQFYLFWPLVFLFPKKIWVFIFSSLAFLSITFRVLSVDIDYVNYFHTFSVLIDLVIGGFFALGVKRSMSFRTLFEKANTISHFILFSLAFCILYFGTSSLFKEYNASFSRVLSSLIFGLIITSQAFTKNKSILNLSNFKFGTKWGKLTYGIYLLHPIAITIIDLSFRVIKIDYKTNFYSEFGVSILMFLLTLFLSKISYNYLELRFLNLKSKYQIIKTGNND
ncbi:MAG: acyltransferase [Fluviicola sp.]|nr:acyltransferase [Fluviicola sp.]